MGKTLDELNVSGLEKRASLLLNIKQSGNESLLTTFEGKHDKEDDFNELYSYLEFVPKDTTEGFINLDKLYEIQSTFGIDEDELDEDLKDELDRMRASLKEEEDESSEEEKVDDEAAEEEKLNQEDEDELLRKIASLDTLPAYHHPRGIEYGAIKTSIVGKIQRL